MLIAAAHRRMVLLRKLKSILIFFLIGVCFCGCAQSDTEKQWEDFCAAMAAEYQACPGPLTPNYIDSDGWCYFLAEDTRCIYRVAEDAVCPEVVIEDAYGCMTVTDQGILFLRRRENYLGETLWSVKYDLLLWRDGEEILLWKNTNISPQDGCMLSVGNYLVYRAGGKIRIRPILPQDDTISLGAQITVVPDSVVVQNLLWTDGVSLWYGIPEFAYGKIVTIRCMNLETAQYSDHEVYFAAGWDQGHSRPMAVHDGVLYYYTETALCQLDLYTMDTHEVMELPERIDASVYRTSTGECLLRLQHYKTGTFSTTDILTDSDLSFLEKNTVQTIYGNLAIAYAYDYFNDYDYYPRMVVYLNGVRIWKSNGTNFKTDT